MASQLPSIVSLNCAPVYRVAQDFQSAENKPG
jgi:hypothetical protein